MKIYEVQERALLMDALLKIWEASVRTTHQFLSDAEIVYETGENPLLASGLAFSFGKQGASCIIKNVDVEN